MAYYAGSFSKKSFMRKHIDECRRGGDSPPGDFAYKITSPEAIIDYFLRKSNNFVKNCWLAANGRPYRIVVGFLIFDTLTA